MKLTVEMRRCPECEKFTLRGTHDPEQASFTFRLGNVKVIVCSMQCQLTASGINKNTRFISDMVETRSAILQQAGEKDV